MILIDELCPRVRAAKPWDVRPQNHSPAWIQVLFLHLFLVSNHWYWSALDLTESKLDALSALIPSERQVPQGILLKGMMGYATPTMRFMGNCQWCALQHIFDIADSTLQSAGGWCKSFTTCLLYKLECSPRRNRSPNLSQPVEMMLRLIEQWSVNPC